MLNLVNSGSNDGMNEPVSGDIIVEHLRALRMLLEHAFRNYHMETHAHIALDAFACSPIYSERKCFATFASARYIISLF